MALLRTNITENTTGRIAETNDAHGQVNTLTGERAGITAAIDGKATSTDLTNHLAAAYHAGGVAFAWWNGTAWGSRPASAGMVIWAGGTTKPPEMASTDVWVKPDSGGVVSSYIAEHTFEGYADAANLVALVANGSGTPLDVISLGTGGGTAKARASTVAGGTKVGEFATSTTASTTWGAFRASVGTRTKVTVGTRWITPGTLPPANMQVLRTRRDSGGGTFVTAPAMRYNSTNGHIEVLGADGVVALTTALTVSTAIAYYDLELELDCDNLHMRGWVTPAGGASEAIGNTTTPRVTGTQVDEYACGMLSSIASQSQRFKNLRVADIGIRVNG